MGITLADNLRPLTRGPLTIQDRGITHEDIVWDPRIGIRVGTDKMWRATVKGHRSVSGDGAPEGGALRLAPLNRRASLLAVLVLIVSYSYLSASVGISAAARRAGT